MKKLLFFAAALLCLVACNNNEPTAPLTSGEQCTLTATVNFGEAANAPIRKIAPDKDDLPGTTGSTVDFYWEAGDSVFIKNETGISIFHLLSGAGTKTATFTGDSLSDMSSYEVYTFNPNSNEHSTKYVNGTFKPFAKGSGSGASFTLDQFYPVLRLRLYTKEEFSAIPVIEEFSYTIDNPDYGTFASSTCTMKFEPNITLTTATDTTEYYFPIVGVNNSSFTLTLAKEHHVTKGGVEGAGSDKIIVNQGLSGRMNEIIYFDVPVRVECLAAGTLITMADGSVKNVKDIVEGDLIRTFDHEAGCISSAKVCLTYKGEDKDLSLNLTFASGKKLAIVGTHDLLFENTRKYVRINRGNVEQYVGKRFYNTEAGKWDALVSYEMGTPVDYYCIYSAKHLNCIAEGLLTCPDDVDHNLNIYELDANLKADAAQLQADIAQYGLCDVAKDFPEFAQYKEQMEALGSQYVYIAIGKGLVPANYIDQMKSYWLAQ